MKVSNIVLGICVTISVLAVLTGWFIFPLLQKFKSQIHLKAEGSKPVPHEVNPYVYQSPFTKVQWMERAQVNLSELVVAGGTETMDFYVARIKPSGQSSYIPGWFYDHPSQGEKGCIAINGNTYCFGHGKGDFELLAYSNEIVEWIPAIGHFPITPNIIYGGVDPEFNEEVFICRALNKNRTSTRVPGKYVPSKGLCVYEYCGEKIAHRFEILTLSKFGQSSAAGNGRSCKTNAKKLRNIKATPTDIEWVQRSDVIISKLEGGGWQRLQLEENPNFNQTVYVARGEIIKDNTFVPGKFYVHPTSGMGQYGFGYDGRNSPPRNIELLVHRYLSVIWVPSVGHHVITPNHIYGGVDPEKMEEVYVCRARCVSCVESCKNDVVPGKYVPSRGLCSTASGNTEYLFDKYDILTLSSYGNFLGLGNGRKC